MLRIGVDIGGTFTDFVAWREGGAESQSLLRLKVPSTPPDFARGFEAGMEATLAQLPPLGDEAIYVAHGTTVSTNAVIERTGPKIALLTTAGFGDILELQRLRLSDPINMFANRPAPLVPRQLVFEIDERMRADGTVERALDLASFDEAVAKAAKAGVEGIAIAFLNSYRNPVHEVAARDRLHQRHPGFDISLSSEIWPRVGEYERAMVCVLNTFVRKRMNDYIGEIEAYLARRLPGARLLVTRSNGGAMAAREARNFAVHTLLSGPASGVTAARFIGAGRRDAKDRNLLTMDMGGTSTDLSLIRDGLPIVSHDAEVGDFPLMMPVTGIEAIGAGGGSIARIDGPVLRVGPQSAGANPGPACYGRGGTKPTVTDAYLICGYLSPTNFLGGKMALHPAKSAEAMQAIATGLGTDLPAAADACIEVTTSNMVAKILPYLARHGIDPQDVTLVAFGGNGAIHGPLLALEMGIARVLIPALPSVFCAFGGVVTELIHDTVSIVQGAASSIDGLRAEFAKLENAARQWLADQAQASDLVATEIEYWAEMRYAGQSFNLAIKLDPAALGAADLLAVENSFHDEHERLHAHADRAASVSIVELRVRVRGGFAVPKDASAATSASVARKDGRRTLRINGMDHKDAPIVDRESLSAGDVVTGPAVIEQRDATILVPPGCRATIEASGDILIDRNG